MERVKGMFFVFVVCVVCILLWWVYILVKFIGERVIGSVIFLLNSLVFKFSLDILFSMCWCRVMLVRLLVLCLSVCFLYELLLM